MFIRHLLDSTQPAQLHYKHFLNTTNVVVFLSHFQVISDFYTNKLAFPVPASIF